MVQLPQTCHFQPILESIILPYPLFSQPTYRFWDIWKIYHRTSSLHNVNPNRCTKEESICESNFKLRIFTYEIIFKKRVKFRQLMLKSINYQVHQITYSTIEEKITLEKETQKEEI
ncbi:hypothetical protein Dimus_015163 [Dionaea muscipula]